MHRYTPMTEGYIFLPRAVRPEVKKYNPRSEVDHHSIYTEKEVCFPYNFDLLVPFLFTTGVSITHGTTKCHPHNFDRQVFIIKQ